MLARQAVELETSELEERTIAAELTVSLLQEQLGAAQRQLGAKASKESTELREQLHSSERQISALTSQMQGKQAD